MLNPPGTYPKVLVMKFDASQQGDQPSEKTNETPVCTLKPAQRLRAGMVCPRCHQARIEYNGLLNLVCPKCGLTEVGAST